MKAPLGLAAVVVVVDDVVVVVGAADVEVVGAADVEVVGAADVEVVGAAVVVVGAAVVVVPPQTNEPSGDPAPQESQQLDAAPTQACPPLGGLHWSALRLVEHF